METPNGGYACAPVYSAARVATLLRISYTEEELKSFGPPPAAVEGYVTFFDPGWSILQLRTAFGGKNRILYPTRWYEAEAFAQRTCDPQYRQLLMEPVEGSFTKTFAEQTKLLDEDLEVPLARVVVMGTAIHSLGSDTRLFQETLVRCRDEDSNGSNVYVGPFPPSGLNVRSYSGACRHANVGLSAARKL